MQSRNRDTDAENKCKDTKGGKRGGGVGGGVMYWETGIDMYTLMYIKWMTNKKINRKNKKIKANTVYKQKQLKLRVI